MTNVYKHSEITNSKSDQEFNRLVAAIDDSTAVETIDADSAQDIRFDADDSAPDYIGLNKTNGAATSAETWIVYKFTYSGSNVTRIQKAYGSWDGRAALFV